MNSYKQHLYISCIRITANMLMVAAVFAAMYQSARSVNSAELVFCAWFFGITVSVWAAAFWLTRQVRRRFPAEGQSMVQLPREGLSLVSWRVLESSPSSLMAQRS
ncbi:hypothetical protein [Desulfovibrio intestinalis]|uniref:Uncharacterized protein n=1 Tax=Desulfovibrio intestinalis TaxID=58621 RepID=A0A7W8BZ07_9BACT|nr:hypothetical protein [Desulfovibrio intestinalis]MBB5142555.1 hypothetical protein [Desulfovibrio intestinalis]